MGQEKKKKGYIKHVYPYLSKANRIPQNSQSHMYSIRGSQSTHGFLKTTSHVTLKGFAKYSSY